MSVGVSESQARWLLRQAFAIRNETTDTLGKLVALTGAPAALQAEACRLARGDFFEGFCPIHRGPFVVEIDGDHRQAYCEPCNRNWGWPSKWAAEDDL